MRQRLKFAAVITFGLLNVDPAHGRPAPAADPQGGLPQVQRVESIGYRLSEASPGLCPRPRPLLGMRLHEPGSYDPQDRAQALATYHFARGAGVQRVVPGSAAAQAGLQSGDVIVAAGSADLATFRTDLIGRDASYDRVAAIEALIEERIAAGEAYVMVEAPAGTNRRVELADRKGCVSRFLLAPDRAPAAWSDEQGVAVTPALVTLAGSDDALAFAIAHEMAHVILCHSCGKGSSLLATFGVGSKAWRAAELEADAMALALVGAAGFDQHAAIDLLNALERAGLGRRTGTHPAAKHRLAAIMQLLEEARQAAPR